MCDDKAGVHLTEGSAVLYDIVDEFTTRGSVKALAIYLLEGVDRGGAAYVEKLLDADPERDLSDVAFNTLRLWCSAKPQESYGGKLVNVLRERKVGQADTAEKFLCKLVPEGGSETQPVAGKDEHALMKAQFFFQSQ